LSALPRYIWALDGASTEHLKKISAELNYESEQNAKNLPQVAVIMAEVEKKAHPKPLMR
jgi:hypothetical protein